MVYIKEISGAPKPSVFRIEKSRCFLEKKSGICQSKKIMETYSPTETEEKIAYSIYFHLIFSVGVHINSWVSYFLTFARTKSDSVNSIYTYAETIQINIVLSSNIVEATDIIHVCFFNFFFESFLYCVHLSHANYNNNNNNRKSLN